MAFEYNPIEIETVADVELIPRTDSRYQSYLKDIYDSGETPQYERWANQYPETAQEFKELAEHALANPTEVVEKIFSDVYRAPDRVCGECWNAKDDDYRDSDEAIVCWENRPNENSRRPRKLTRDSDFAQECDLYDPKDEFVEKRGYHSAIGMTYFLKNLNGDNSDDDQEKAALKYAYYQTWGRHEETDNERSGFNPNRERAMLNHLSSDFEDTPELGSGGKEFEKSALRILENAGYELHNRVFRITHNDGEINFKEMDVHLKLDQTPVIAELFTSRLPSEKKKQVQNYASLYEAATGFHPETYLVTDELYEYVKGDEGDLEKRHVREDGDVMNFSRFRQELRKMTGDDFESVPLSKYLDDEDVQ